LQLLTDIYKNTELWALLTALSMGTFCACVGAFLTRLAPVPVPVGGRRGAQRRAAQDAALFRAIEPGLRLLASALHVTLRRALGSRGRRHLVQVVEMQRRHLMWAGDPWGLDPFEMIFLSLIVAGCGATLGLELGSEENSLLWVLPLGLMGAALPHIRLQSLCAERFSEMTRELPAAIDLIALSMNAGSDFPGAIRRIIDGQQGVVAEELGYLLRSLDLGITRAAALLALRERVPVQEVRDLVRAIILAEKKGASVTDALVQQARSSRQRRSVRAEEAAARAGVLLLVPLMLLMACIMILLVGPLLISGVGL
jgi:tight adherence protein C